jgi:hypothetical protein
MSEQIEKCAEVLTSLQSVKTEMSKEEFPWSDSIRLIERSEIFSDLVMEMKRTPQMLDDSDEVEVNLLVEMERVLYDVRDYVKEFTNRESFKGMTEPSFRQGCASDFAKLNARIIKLAQSLNMIEDIDYDAKRAEDLVVSCLVLLFVAINLTHFAFFPTLSLISTVSPIFSLPLLFLGSAKLF